MPTAHVRTPTFHVREYRRFPVHCSMYFSSDQVYGTGTIWNLSLGGWRVDSDVDVERGMSLTLFVMLPDRQQAVLIDHAIVCWSRGKEFGLTIRSITPQDAARLKEFVTTLI